MSSKQDRMQAYFQKVAEIVRRDGWMIQGVFPAGPGDGPGFAYTIGLSDAGLPELLMTGNLDHKVLQQLLNSAAAIHLKQELKPGGVVKDIASVDFRVVACGPDAPVQQAHNYARDPERRLGKVKVLQLLWPDKAGAYPDTIFWTTASGDQPMYPPRA